MSGHLSVGDRWRIISLYFDQSVLPSQIVVILDCSALTVRRILRLYDETGDVRAQEGRSRSLLRDTGRTEIYTKGRASTGTVYVPNGFVPSQALQKM